MANLDSDILISEASSIVLQFFFLMKKGASVIPTQKQPDKN